MNEKQFSKAILAGVVVLLVFLSFCTSANAQVDGQRAQVQMRYVTSLPATCVPNQSVIYAVIGSLPIHYHICTNANTFVDITGAGAGTVAGSNTHVQFNDSGNFGGVAGFVFDKTSKVGLGVAGTSVGSIDFSNATSGRINLAPTTGALGTSNLVLPARSATVATTTGTLTSGRLAEFDGSGNLVQSSITAGTAAPLTATQIGYGSGGNVLTGSTRLIWDNTNRTMTLGEAGNSGTTDILLSSTSTTSAFKMGSASGRPGSQGGLILPFVGGSQSSGPGIWFSDGNYNATMGMWVNLGFNFQGSSSSTSPVKFRKGTGTSSDGSSVFEVRPDDGYIGHFPFGTSSTNVGSSRYYELAANGTNYIGIRAPDSVSNDLNYTLPNAPSNNSSPLLSSTTGVLSYPTGTPDGTKFLRDDGTWQVPSGSGGGAGGSDTQVQRNNGGALGGITGVTSDGTNITAGSGNLRATSPRITTQISDANGNAMLAFTPTASAVNYFSFTNTATATVPKNIFQVTGSDSAVGLHIKTKQGSYPDVGQVYFDTNIRYDRPQISFWDSGAGYLTDTGIGVQSGGAWLNLKAPNIMLGAGDGTPGYVGITGNSYLAWNVNNTAAPDCPACVAVGFNKPAQRVIGVVGADSTPDGDLTHGATFGFIANTPSQITSAQNNYDPGDTSYFQRWSSDASRNITGMTFAISTKVSGQVHQIWNVGSNDLNLVHESASSTAANRFNTTDTLNITLTGGQCANVIYDGVLSRWRASRCEGSGGGGSGPTINATDGILPYRSNSTTFTDTNLGYSSNALTQTLTSLGTTLTESFKQVNTTAAAAGAQQVSPAFVQEGQGWKTNSTAASQSVKFSHYVLPVQGTSAPSGLWKFGSSINGGAYSDVLQLSSAGQVLTPLGTQAAPGLVIGQSITSTGLLGNGTRIQFSIANSAGVVVDTTGLRLRSSERFCFDSTSDPANGSPDSCFGRNAAGRIEANNGTNGTYRDLIVRQHYVDQTITAGGTTGNQTINKAAGTVNVAASGTAVTVTNSLVTTSSTVHVSTRTNDTTCYVKNVVPGSGTFTINLVAACTAETSFGFLVVN